MKFDEIPGHGEVKKILRGMVYNKRIPHALLFLGEEGGGNLPMAFAFAQFIFCENKTEKDSCGHCASCSKVTRLEHADLHFSFPSIVPRSGVKAMSRHYIGEIGRAHV